MREDILNSVNEYYTNKIKTFGRSPEGVDWNGIESQEIRFEQLSKVFEKEKSTQFSLLDFGCGFGSYLTYLEKGNVELNYTGYDISEEMIKNAKLQFDGKGKWIQEIPENFRTDYVVASGLFNVKLNQNVKDWESYILNTLKLIDSISNKGFSFNILTSYSDKEYMKDYLYYASPEFFFNFCKVNYSKEVSLLHDYGLYEFTILVKK
jgi:SAM-dependent methyltransferase